VQGVARALDGWLLDDCEDRLAVLDSGALSPSADALQDAISKLSQSEAATIKSLLDAAFPVISVDSLA
jgi:hypothetical protein